MEPLSGKREHPPGADTAGIITKADNAIVSASATGLAPDAQIELGADRSAHGLGLPHTTKVPFHFAPSAVIVSRWPLPMDYEGLLDFTLPHSASY